MVPVKINWHEVPFLRILLPFSIGILVQERGLGVFAPINVLAGSAILMIIPMVWLSFIRIPHRWRWVFGLSFSIFWICSGALLHSASDQSKSKLHYSKYSEPVGFIGHVAGLSLRQEKLRLEVRISEIIDSSSEQQQAIGKLYLFIPIPKNDLPPDLGDLVLFRGLLRAVEAPKNPFAFDYKTYLRRRNIHFQVFSDSGQWMVLKPEDGFPLKRTLNQYREKLLDILAKHLPEEDAYGVASALILGHREATPDDLAAAFAATGATHVLAVSGLHVGIVQLILATLLNFLTKRHPKMALLKTGMLISGVWLFSLLTGGAGSALRAATMFSLLTLGKVLNRGISPYNSLAASAFILILPDTNRLFDVGFQLSYLAVAGIVFFYPIIYKLWYIPQRLGNYFWQLTVLSIAATLVTVPISLMYFHQFPVYFWLSGLVAVPLSGVILGMGLMLFSVDWIPFLADFAGWILNFAVTLLNTSIRTVEQMPAHLISGIWISEAGTWALYFAILSLAMGIGFRNFKGILSALIIICLASCFHAWTLISNKNQKEVILYHVRGNTVLDCLDGENVISVSKKPISGKELEFSIQNYRWSRRIKKQYAFELNQSPGGLGNWFYMPGILEFFETRIAFVGTGYRNKPPEKFPTDYLILYDNPKITISELLKIWDIRKNLIVIDSSNKTHKVSEWIKECEVMGVRYHDVAANGAWRIKLKNR